MWGKAIIVFIAILFSKWLGLIFFILFIFAIHGEIILIKYKKYKDEIQITDEPRGTPDFFEMYKNCAIERYKDIYRVKTLENHIDLGFDYKSIDQAKKSIDNI